MIYLSFMFVWRVRILEPMDEFSSVTLEPETLTEGLQSA